MVPGSSPAPLKHLPMTTQGLMQRERDGSKRKRSSPTLLLPPRPPTCRQISALIFSLRQRPTSVWRAFAAAVFPSSDGAVSSARDAAVLSATAAALLPASADAAVTLPVVFFPASATASPARRAAARAKPSARILSSRAIADDSQSIAPAPLHPRRSQTNIEPSNDPSQPPDAAASRSEPFDPVRDAAPVRRSTLMPFDPTHGDDHGDRTRKREPSSRSNEDEDDQGAQTGAAGPSTSSTKPPKSNRKMKKTGTKRGARSGR
ncbi:hypothetical protein B0H63DRAFT_534525 [Podospora didyma]|uniref:Uncharacterized protein n=1 Tax=Podospora didyma TaxID=330526 RepID=A0AAE0K1I9_9PEZI|nr:hypothetical protein B0H63DRAFT_534525 [Podospora didyma]